MSRSSKYFREGKMMLLQVQLCLNFTNASFTTK
uniref:Uncharacterized protein n=2 Tax=Anguilla anguilla TaxID=7936 RepID=A0A0E9QK77_ANGAN